MDTETIYKKVYKKHENPDMRVNAPKPTLHITTEPMDLLTSYRSDYKRQNGNRPNPFRPRCVYEPKGAFVGTSVYQSNYQALGQALREQCRATPIRHKEAIIKDIDTFDAESVMKGDYTEHKDAKKIEILPRPKEETREMQGGTFYGDTTYAKEYVVKEGVPVYTSRTVRGKPTKKPFDDLTTFEVSYRSPGRQRPPQSYKEQLTYKPCTVPFDGKTIFSEAYQTWNVQKPVTPAWAKQNTYKPPSSKLHGKTSYREDFKLPEQSERARLIRPHSPHIPMGDSSARFTRRSHYSKSYKAYRDPQPAQSYNVKHVYKGPKEKFFTESVYQANYKGQYAEAAKLCPHPPAAKLNSDEVHFKTTYLEKYTGVGSAPCAGDAIIQEQDLPTQKRQYTLIRERNGHQYYLATSNEQ